MCFIMSLPLLILQLTYGQLISIRDLYVLMSLPFLTLPSMAGKLNYWFVCNTEFAITDFAINGAAFVFNNEFVPTIIMTQQLFQSNWCKFFKGHHQLCRRILVVELVHALSLIFVLTGPNIICNLLIGKISPNSVSKICNNFMFKKLLHVNRLFIVNFKIRQLNKFCFKKHYFLWEKSW